MARRIREVVYDDDVVVSEPAPTRRVVTERRVGPGGGYGWGMNPAAVVMMLVVSLFILILLLGVAR